MILPPLSAGGVTVPSYAKVNLYLDVRGKRPDGYHQLETLFERIDLADQIQIETRREKGIEFACAHPQVPEDQTNLVVRAVQAYQQATGWSAGLRIILEKRIPVSAGLGGGSSNAAATLLALQRFCPRPLSKGTLAGLAQRLGADVPFFLAQVPWAVGRGRGDEIDPLELTREFWHLLVTPDLPISTAEIYAAWTPPVIPAQPLTGSNPNATLIFRALRGQHADRVSELLFNALEPAVEALYPAIRQVKKGLQALGAQWRPCLSGSGSSIFALADSHQAAQEAAASLRRSQPGWRVFVAKTRA
jgi:4-diphosphocytidyl-2-C-methyl-D-erythritol kinase